MIQILKSDLAFSYVLGIFESNNNNWQLNQPRWVAIGREESMYVTDTYKDHIQLDHPSGMK